MSSTPTPERPASRRGPFWSLFPELEAAFGLLSTGWAPLGVQGRAVAAEWPDRLIPVGELRARLLHPACPYPTRDRTLNTVLDLARTEGDPWLLVLVGLLLPGLRRSARTLLLANSGLAADLEAEMFAGLLTAIRTGPANRARPGAELIWAARRAADRLRQAEHAERGFAELGELPPAPSHPDHVLARAVAAGVLSADDAELIAATRLGQLSLHSAAELRAISYQSAHRRRSRAELTLSEWLAHNQGGSTATAGESEELTASFVIHPPKNRVHLWGGPGKDAARPATRGAPPSRPDQPPQGGEQCPTRLCSRPASDRPPPRSTHSRPKKVALSRHLLTRTGVVAGVVAGTGLVLLAAAGTSWASPLPPGVHAAAAPSLNGVIDSLRTWLVGILATLATLFLTIGGIRYLLAGGDPMQVERAKTALKSAAIGYALAVLAPLLVTILTSVVGG